VDGEDEVLQAQYVFHLASPASPVHYQSDPHFTFTTNVLGMQNVLEYADVFGARVLFSSTSEVYGDPLVHPQEESYWGNVNSFGPRSCYDEGKRASETLCYIYLNTKQTDVRIARIFNTYGPRMALNDGRVVSTMVLQTLQSQPVPMHGSGTQTRSFCFVSDMVAGLVALMRVEPRPSTPVNLGNPNEITIAELSERIVAVLKAQGRKTESTIKHLPPALDDPQRRKPNITLAGELLGWSPQIALDVGLAKTIDFFAAELAAGHRPL
jgi:UDP-glucuronate decarboxylase